MKLSRQAEAITTSPILLLASEINQRKAQGEEVYNLTVGDFDPNIFPIPDCLTELTIQAYRDHHTNYPGAFGLPHLRDAVSALLKRSCGIDVSSDEIQIASGSRPLIYSFYKSVVDPGDRVVYPVPSWNNDYYTQLHDGIAVPVDTRVENNFFPTAEDLEPVLKDAVLLSLCSPQNPTGTLLDREQLISICELVVAENQRRSAEQKPLYVMFDQVYWLLTFGEYSFHHPLALCPEIKPFAVFVDGISKSLAGTGVRVGWATGPAPILERMRAFIAHVGAWAPKAEQVATGQFLAEPEAVDGFLDGFKSLLNQRLDGFYQGIQKLKQQGFDVDAVAPQASIYLSIRLNLKGLTTADGELLETDEQVRLYLLKEGIGILPFSWFGAEKHADWYRISVGTCSQQSVERSMAKLAKALNYLE